MDGRTTSVSTQLDQQQTFLSWTHKNQTKKYARPNQGQGRKKRGNRLGVEAKALCLRSRKRMRGTERPILLTEMGSEEQKRQRQSTASCERDQESQI